MTQTSVNHNFHKSTFKTISFLSYHILTTLLYSALAKQARNQQQRLQQQHQQHNPVSSLTTP